MRQLGVPGKLSGVQNVRAVVQNLKAQSRMELQERRSLGSDPRAVREEQVRSRRGKGHTAGQVTPEGISWEAGGRNTWRTEPVPQTLGNRFLVVIYIMLQLSLLFAFYCKGRPGIKGTNC